MLLKRLIKLLLNKKLFFKLFIINLLIKAHIYTVCAIWFPKIKLKNSLI